jgi:hypothetical protein
MRTCVLTESGFHVVKTTCSYAFREDLTVQLISGGPDIKKV